jgi:hypothetical protein
MKPAPRAALLAAGALLASAASAHDFFLLPGAFVTDGAGEVTIQATVSSSFPAAEILVPADRTERLSALGPGNPRLKVAGAGNKALNLELTGSGTGLIAIGVASKPRDVDYREDRIPLILEEYRVGPEAAAAVEALPRPRTWQISSRRFAKTFVCVRLCGDRGAAARTFGAHLEFVGVGTADHHFRLLAHGRPLRDYPVDLVGADGERRHLKTDARGDVHVPATLRGVMMLFAARLDPPAGQGRFTLDLTSLTLSRT